MNKPISMTELPKTKLLSKMQRKSCKTVSGNLAMNLILQNRNKKQKKEKKQKLAFFLKYPNKDR